MNENSRANRPDADLSSKGSQLVRRLSGNWYGDHGMCRCPAHDDRRPSLSVRVGQHALLFKCFAGCPIGAVLEAIRQLDEGALGRGRRSISNDRRGISSSLWLKQRARDLWAASQPLQGTLAARYLARRGLAILPASLRFFAQTPLGRGRVAAHRPALLAAVEEAEEGIVAVQRSFLDDESASLAADIGNARLLLGRPLSGAVRLAPASVVLGLAEGIETALSATTLLDIPVWATLGSERMGHIVIPSRVRHLVLLPDRDQAGERGAAKALAAYRQVGRRLDVVLPPSGFKDWNDVLRMEGKGVGRSGDRWIEWSARLRQEITDHA